MRALDLILDAYARLNRLAPGETLPDEDAAFALARLNTLVDELAAQRNLTFLSVQTSAAQTGQITLGAGSWAAIAPGDQIVAASADNLPLQPITMAQYNAIYQPLAQGRPQVWAQDGLGGVLFWPVPTGQTIRLITRAGVQVFADLITQYTLPDGWFAALSAALAVRLAMPLLGKVAPELRREERRLLGVVSRADPQIVDTGGVTSGSRSAWPPRMF